MKKVKIEGCKNHPNGCYIKFTNKKIIHTKIKKVHVDYDKNNEIVGIEFEW